eukprot:Sdes_comp19314_c0_seq1m10441
MCIFAGFSRDLFYQVNVDGCKNIIDSCMETNVMRLVLTSSASVCFEGKDLKNGREDMKYASRPIDYYTETKILQEQMVLDANCDQLFTAAIRPHSIFGPRDQQMVPTIVEAARNGKMKFIIGDGKNLVDFSYVKNIVHGHILAMEHLCKGSPCCGEAFHITNDEPIPFWDFISKILEALHYPTPQIRIPYLLVFYLSVLVEYFFWILSPLVLIRPVFSPMRVALSGTHHYYSTEKAKKLLGYKPIYALKEGISETVKYYDFLRNENKQLDQKKSASAFWNDKFYSYLLGFFFLMIVTLSTSFLWMK